MIIRQTTTIVFEYPQDYLQEQEWCKTKEERWIHKSTDTLGAVYENTISYNIGQPKEGECFKNTDGRIFIKTRDKDFMRKILCVNLESGATIWVDDDCFVKPIKIKAVEE